MMHISFLGMPMQEQARYQLMECDWITCVAITIGGTLFQLKIKNTELTWTAPVGNTKRQMDHIPIHGKWRDRQTKQILRSISHGLQLQCHSMANQRRHCTKT